METINLVFRLVGLNSLKYYLEIDGVMVFPEKYQSKYCIFQIDSPLTEQLRHATDFVPWGHINYRPILSTHWLHAG